MAWLYKYKQSTNWWIGYRVGGKQRAKSTGTSDRAEAQRKLEKFQQKLGRQGRKMGTIKLAALSKADRGELMDSFIHGRFEYQAAIETGADHFIQHFDKICTLVFQDREQGANAENLVNIQQASFGGLMPDLEPIVRGIRRLLDEFPMRSGLCAALTLTHRIQARDAEFFRKLAEYFEMPPGPVDNLRGEMLLLSDCIEESGLSAPEVQKLLRSREVNADLRTIQRILREFGINQRRRGAKKRPTIQKSR